MFLRESVRSVDRKVGGNVDPGSSQVDNPTSLENVETKVILSFLLMGTLRLNECLQWIDEIIEFCPGVKVYSNPLYASFGGI